MKINLACITRPRRYFLLKWLALFVVGILCSCNMLINGNRGYCGSIQQSKKLGVFISEYRPKNNHYIFGDSLAINIKSAWMEHAWQHTGNFIDEKEIDTNAFHLIILVDGKSVLHCMMKLLIKPEGSTQYLGCSTGGALLGDFTQAPRDPSIKCEVEDLAHPDSAGHRATLGYMVFERVGGYNSGYKSREVYHGKLLIPAK